MLYLCVYCIYAIILVNSAVTLPAQISPTQAPKVDPTISSKEIILPIEGGSIMTSTPDLSHSKKKQLNLIELDKEIGQLNKTTVKSRIRPDISEETKLEALSPASERTNSMVPSKPDTSKNEPQESHPTKITDSKAKNNISTTSTMLPKKPLILSDEALRNADKNVKQDEYKLPTSKPSNTKPNLTKTQIPSPNDETVLKLYPAKADSHPRMIMPIVITILVVPMFAIVSYMVLRRGQEAWKNRHYKRMDFLLDGMYND